MFIWGFPLEDDFDIGWIRLLAKNLTIGINALEGDTSHLARKYRTL